LQTVGVNVILCGYIRHPHCRPKPIQGRFKNNNYYCDIWQALSLLLLLLLLLLMMMMIVVWGAL